MRVTATVLLLLVLSPFTRPFKTVDFHLVLDESPTCAAPADAHLKRITGDGSGFTRALPTRQHHVSPPGLMPSAAIAAIVPPEPRGRRREGAAPGPGASSVPILSSTLRI